jgi:hypothetical protein
MRAVLPDRAPIDAPQRAAEIALPSQAFAAHCLADKAELAHPDIRFSSESMYVEGRALIWEEPMQRRSKLVVLVIFTFAAMLFGLGQVIKPQSDKWTMASI